MIDLPIASTEPNSSRAVTTRQSANSPRHADSTQADESPFQAVLALELGLASTGQPPQDAAAYAAPAKAGSILEPVGDAARTAASSDAVIAPACAGAIAFLPAITSAARAASGLNVGDDTAQTTAGGDAPVPPALAVVMAYPPALPGVPITPPAAPVVSPLPAGSSPASTERARTTSDPRQNRLLQESTARHAEIQSPALPSAADFAAPGKFSLSAEGEIRREVPFGANLPNQHMAAPAPAPSPAAAIAIANHSDGAALVQVEPVPVAALEARVGDRGWDRGLGDKLVWMAGQKHQVAELHLNPPDLGPLKITLTLNDDQASALFISAHAAVREAIETAMPRLRETLADNGITLGNASVSTDAFREQAQPQQEPRAYLSPNAAAATEPGAAARGELMLHRSHGLVDTFA